MWLQVVAVIVAFVLGVGGGWTVQGWRKDEAAAVIRAEAATAREKAISEAMAEADRRLSVQQEATNAAEVKARRAQSAATVSGVAADSLREHIARIVADAGTCDSAPSTVSPTKRLADVLNESVAEYRTVAEVADRAIIVGGECSDRYDALIGTKNE